MLASKQLANSNFDVDACKRLIDVVRLWGYD